MERWQTRHNRPPCLPRTLRHRASPSAERPRTQNGGRHRCRPPLAGSLRQAKALCPVPPGLRPKPKLRCGFPFGFALAQRLRFRLDRPVRESGFGSDPKAELPRASSRRATPPSLAPLRAPKSLRRSVAGGVRGAFRFRRAAPGHICKLSHAPESRQHNRLWIKRITGISPAPRRAGYGRRNRARRPVRIRTRWAQ